MGFTSTFLHLSYILTSLDIFPYRTASFLKYCKIWHERMSLNFLFPKFPKIGIRRCDNNTTLCIMLPLEKPVCTPGDNIRPFIQKWQPAINVLDAAEFF